MDSKTEPPSVRHHRAPDARFVEYLEHNGHAMEPALSDPDGRCTNCGLTGRQISNQASRGCVAAGSARLGGTTVPDPGPAYARFLSRIGSMDLSRVGRVTGGLEDPRLVEIDRALIDLEHAHDAAVKDVSRIERAKATLFEARGALAAAEADKLGILDKLREQYVRADALQRAIQVELEATLSEVQRVYVDKTEFAPSHTKESDELDYSRHMRTRRLARLKAALGVE